MKKQPPSAYYIGISLVANIKMTELPHDLALVQAGIMLAQSVSIPIIQHEQFLYRLKKKTLPKTTKVYEVEIIINDVSYLMTFKELLQLITPTK